MLHLSIKPVGKYEKRVFGKRCRERKGKSMKRRGLYRVLSLALLLSLALGSAAAKADLLEDIREKGYIVIATEGDWAPWTYHDENDNLVGLDIEIGKAIAACLGVEARFEETNWDAILAGVDSGRFDIACNGVGYTEARAEKYSFSTPYVYTRDVLVVRSDNDAIRSFEDLKGKKTANTASSTYAALAESYGATVTGVDALADTIQLVLQGRVDATINAQVTINDYLTEHPDAQSKVVAESEGSPVAYPLRKVPETETLLAAVNEALQALRDNGTLSEISMKYFNGLDMTKSSSGQ